MVQIMGKIGPIFGPNRDHKLDLFFPWTSWGKIWSINWSYFGPNIGQNMDIIYCWAIYGQNMDHKLVIKWAKLDHEKVWAKYGQSMVHKLGKLWARFGPNREPCFACMVGVWFCCVYLWLIMVKIWYVVLINVDRCL